MRRRLTLLAAALALLSAPRPALVAQERDPSLTTVIDSIDVVGLRRVTRPQALAYVGLPVGQEISYRDVQRAVQALYGSGQFDDIQVLQGEADGRQILRFTVVERPVLLGWSVRGVEKLTVRSVRGKVKLDEGRPYNPAAATQALAAIDSLYRKQGYYRRRAEVRVAHTLWPVFYVRLKIRARMQRAPLEALRARLALAAGLVALQAACLFLLPLGIAAGALGWLALLAVVAPVTQTVIGAVWLHRPVVLKRLGFLLVGHAAAYGLLVAFLA